MKVEKIECPYCGGPIDLAQYKSVKFCPYCGQPVHITDGSTVTINKNIKIEKHEQTEHTERIINEAEIEKQKRLQKRDENRVDPGTYILLFAILVFCFIGMMYILKNGIS